ncbi:MAG: hypothetical protein AAF529_05695 [Pseudomonadota bacterium]
MNRCALGLVLTALALVPVPVSVQAESYFLDQFAATADQRASWQAGMDAFARFAATDEFIGRRADQTDSATREALDEHCLVSRQTCLVHISNNRAAILSALPSNPLYWQNFWALFEHNIGTHPGHEIHAQNLKLLEGMKWWYLRDLADDGQLNLDQLMTVFEGLSFWLAEHHTIISRNIYRALQMEMRDQISFAMGQASRQRDTDALLRLSAATQPIPPAALSVGQIFWLERDYARHNYLLELDEDGTIDVEARLLDAPPDMDLNVARSLLEDPEGFVNRDLDILAQHYVPQSTMSWSRYWREGISVVDESAFELPIYGAVIGPSYASYINSDRHAVFGQFLLQALADIYAGRVSPGLPARPAPSLWRWQWVAEAPSKLCLVSDEIHAKTRLTQQRPFERKCVIYYDERTIESVHVP